MYTCIYCVFVLFRLSTFILIFFYAIVTRIVLEDVVITHC